MRKRDYWRKLNEITEIPSMKMNFLRSHSLNKPTMFEIFHISWIAIPASSRQQLMSAGLSSTIMINLLTRIYIEFLLVAPIATYVCKIYFISVSRGFQSRSLKIIQLLSLRIDYVDCQHIIIGGSRKINSGAREKSAELSPPLCFMRAQNSRRDNHFHRFLVCGSKAIS